MGMIVKIIKIQRFEFDTEEEMFNTFPQIKEDRRRYYVGETQFGDGDEDEIYEILVKEN